MPAATQLHTFAGSFPPAMLARAVIGAGDAMAFVSVIRLVSAWILVRQAPFVTQLTGRAGQLGAVVAAALLALALEALGWTTHGLGGPGPAAPGFGGGDATRRGLPAPGQSRLAVVGARKRVS